MVFAHVAAYSGKDCCCTLVVQHTLSDLLNGFGMQDVIPAETSVIVTLLTANNKATGTKLTHM